MAELRAGTPAQDREGDWWFVNADGRLLLANVGGRLEPESWRQVEDAFGPLTIHPHPEVAAARIRVLEDRLTHARKLLSEAQPTAACEEQQAQWKDAVDALDAEAAIEWWLRDD